VCKIMGLCKRESVILTLDTRCGHAGKPHWCVSVPVAIFSVYTVLPVQAKSPENTDEA
jgi:hypothetical protein